MGSSPTGPTIELSSTIALNATIKKTFWVFLFLDCHVPYNALRWHLERTVYEFR